YVKNLLSKEGIEASKEIVSLLIERNGQNVNAIVEDINYIRNHFQPSEYISSDKAMEILFRKSGESSVFDLLNALMSGDKHRAILSLHNIIDRGEDVFALGSLIYSQLQKILKVKKFLDTGVSDDEISKQTGISSFELRNIKKVAKNVDNRKVSFLLKFILELEASIRGYDENLKLANVERLILQMP
ncbi:MAG: DNA polymerase III subunit delta, partial [Brevinematia bacterium]